jgi:hypothetical protein
MPRLVVCSWSAAGVRARLILVRGALNAIMIAVSLSNTT